MKEEKRASVVRFFLSEPKEDFGQNIREMGARATRTARCASEKKRPKRSKEHFERSHAITPSAQPSRRPFRSAFSRNLTTPHTTETKISRKRARRKKKAIERIDANARDATTRRFRAQTDTMRE
jgi:hypothetical protein